MENKSAKPRIIAMVGNDSKYFYLTYRKDVKYNWNICESMRHAYMYLFAAASLPAQPLPYFVARRLRASSLQLMDSKLLP